MKWIGIALLPISSSVLMSAECIAHRGDSANHPDNTVEAIQSAWKAGADVVEMDVRMLKDGTLVLFHDARIGKAPINSLDHAILEARTPKYHVPTLKEALQAGASGRTLLLDLKEESPVYLNKMLDEVHSSTISGSRVILQSGSFKVLKYLRQHAPAGTPLFYVTNLKTRGAPPNPKQIARSLKADCLQGITAMGRTCVDAAFVDAFHKSGLKYYVWTINNPKEMKHYVDLGVDGVITDDPAGFRKLFPAEKPKKKLPVPG